MYIANAFSLNMVCEFPSHITVEEVSLQEAQQLALNAVGSAVGHTDTAAVFSSVLQTPVQANRVSIALRSGDQLLVGQYRGQRLAEGTTTLPDGAEIRWYLVVLK